MSDETRYQIVMRFPTAAMVLLDLAIAFQWAGMWRAGDGQSQSVVGWAAWVLFAAMTSCIYSTFTPGQWRTVYWSRLTILNALIGLLTVLHFGGVL